MRILLISIIILITGIGNAWSAGKIDLAAPFRASLYTRQELMFIQAGLMMKRIYTKNLDGLWGPSSAEALARYVKEDLEEDTPPTNADAMLVVVSAILEFRKEGWEYRQLPGIDRNILTPKPVEKEDKTDNVLEVYSIDQMTLIRFWHSKAALKEVHFKRMPELNPFAWTRNGRNWVTIGISDEKAAFAYSIKGKGIWESVTVTGDIDDAGKVLLIFESLLKRFRLEVAPSERFVALADDFLEEYEKERVSEGETPNGSQQASVSPQDGDQSKPEKPQQSGSGTGFAVTSDGHLLTNAHVVDGCERISVDDLDAKLLATEENFDLALLQVPDLDLKGVAVFADTPASLNSDITTAGFPLAGLLGGLNITRGTVAARKGLGGSGINMQITAPLQPGNSGGPAVNSSGQVVGVVVAKLNAGAIADAIGDIPQNVNFAIRGTIAQLFLHQNGITPQRAGPGAPLRPEDLASQLSAYTFLVKCN